MLNAPYTLPDYKFAHGDWYLNPWVSSDVLVTLNLDLSPKERGLQSMDDKGLALWYFPKTYPQTPHNAVLSYKKTHPDGS